MPKSKLFLLIFSFLLLAAGFFYWQKGEDALPAAVERVMLPPETAAPEQEGTSTPEAEWVFATEPLMVNINKADVSQLVRLPGIGPAKAAAIVAYRQEKGLFQCIEDLMQVPGIKEGTFSKLQAYVTIE